MSQSPAWIAAARVLRRTGFGATGSDVDALMQRDVATVLDAALAADPNADPGALATPIPSWITPDLPRRGASATEFAAFSAELKQQLSELESWWLRRMAAVRQPIHEKLTLLWHNHFATSAEKVPAAEYMVRQNEKLRTLKLGDFRTLAYAMLNDAAMQLWLDGVQNTREAPNENLSREFMELFTLGHGNGYTEVDVREGARALTGRVVAMDGTTAVSAEKHDPSPKTVLGVTAELDEEGFCDVVLAQPSSAPFIAGVVWKSLASDTDPSDATRARLVAAYGPGRNLSALTKAVLLDPEFAAGTGTVVNTPIEWAVGVVRTLAVPLADADTVTALSTVLTVLGQRPFYPPDVGGWPRGVVWLTTTSTAARVWAAQKFVALGDLSAVAEAPAGDRLDATGYLLGIGRWSDRTTAALTALTADPPRLVAAAVNTPEYLTS